MQYGRIAFGKTYNERHAVLWNPDGCVLGARFGSFTPIEGIDDEVLLALLNSSVTALFIEVLGRASLGQGALDFAVYELESIPVIDPRRIDKKTADALRTAYRLLIKRRPLSVTEEVVAPDKVALDGIVFDTLGLSLDERREVVAALLEMNRGRRTKADSVERVVKVQVKRATDGDVLSFAISQTIAHVGLRRFPETFPMSGPTMSIHPPEGVGTEEPEVEAMMAQGSLVWEGVARIECPTLESAECAALIISLGWPGAVQVPTNRKEAARFVTDLHGYVEACRSRFEQEIVEVGEGEVQAKRLRQMFRHALGRTMFTLPTT